ncbi:2-polyprenyl-6-methoxyphenol hydroxylase-like FAD-dependent oxidoreductase [Rhodococcus sp. 27YEA15]|uniref:FAD-dependent oxidoreductase n=1 Tax=Rhodococcus sp. 27YEA15 TaxID=3156259 RepID=UPI003C7CF1EA
MNTPTLAAERISIIGAGPGGLTCARILQQRGIPVTVYDRDTDSSTRNQGGSLDLHEEDGQLALREAGLLDEFFALARMEGQEMRMLDTTGEVLVSRMPDDDDTFAPEIDRGHLRELLLRSLEPGTVRWNRALESVTGPDSGPRSLVFADGSIVETDLVIGADGASSRVRPAVSDATPSYTGVSFLEAWFDDLDTSHPELAAMIGAGSALASDGDRALFAQRNSGDHMRVYIARREALNWMAEHDLRPDDTSAIRAHLLQEFSDWSPETLRMITDNDGAYVDRPLFALPAPHVWAPSPTVTLLGDAAHLMPPAGIGVNLAMLDACELALALAEADTVDQALRNYESTMFPRSSERAVELDGHADFLLDMGGPDALAGPPEMQR